SFERCLLLSTNGSGHSNPLVNQTFKSGSHEGRYLYQQGRSSLFSFVYTCILVIFIDDTPPNLLLSQAMANRILGCLPTFHIPWRSVYCKIKLLTDKSGQNM